MLVRELMLRLRRAVTFGAAGGVADEEEAVEEGGVFARIFLDFFYDF